MKNLKLLLLLFISTLCCNAQKEYYNWNFGEYAGISFNTGTPVAFTGTAFNQMEGSASISDSAGNLLFYTNGMEVYTSANAQMPNGFGLMGNHSSSMNAVILKQPLSGSLYYIITVDYNHDGLALGDGLRYSIVDMSLNGGLGDVTAKNVLIRLPVYEKVAATKHANGTDYWIVINDWTNDDIISYKLDSAGLDTTPVFSNAGPIHFNNVARTTGCMKVSPCGDKIALALWGNSSYELFNYDNSTGIASNHLSIQSLDMFWAYGVEFSPDESKLYTTKLDAPGCLYQFDISNWNSQSILNSRATIDSNQQQYYFCALQLAPDAKVYCSISGAGSLGVIDNPDQQGLGCNYINNGPSVGFGYCRYGLPNCVYDCFLTTSTFFPLYENEVQIFPNPANDFLHVSFGTASNNCFYRIFDVTNKVVARSKVDESKLKIDLSAINNGVYFIQLFDGNQYISKKFIVQK